MPARGSRALKLPGWNELMNENEGVVCGWTLDRLTHMLAAFKVCSV